MSVVKAEVSPERAPLHGGPATVKKQEVSYFSLLEFQPPPPPDCFGCPGFLRHGAGDWGGARVLTEGALPVALPSRKRGHRKVKGIICICEAKAAAHICIRHMAHVP